MIDVFVSDKYKNLVNIDVLEKAAKTALVNIGYSPNAFSITIVIDDDTTLQKLNAQYAGINKPTDVLSFELNEKDPETGITYLGDIVISFPRASEQARVAGHSIMNELILLLIHGILHLAGYDHVSENDRKHMWSLQHKLLCDLGLGAIKIQV